MERLAKFEHFRFVGDKRALVVYDIDHLDDDAVELVEDMVEAGTYTCFAPDTLAEARNRGYRPFEPDRP